MIFSKGFTTGLLAGAVVGGIAGMCMDPLKDKDSKKLKKTASSIVNSMENVASGMKSMHN